MFDSKASAWDKVFAGADLAFNVVSDVAMVSGIGEAVKTVSTVAKLGGKLLVDVGKNLAKDDAKKVVEDEFSHVAAQSFDDAAKQGVKTATQDVAQAACGGGLSFVFTTKVATAQGEQAIGSLKVGQKVWSYNPQTQKMELQPILHVWINHDNDLVDLTITSTVHGNKGQPIDEVIHTNKKHPFLTQEAGFVPVADLNVGMHVVEADSNVGVITGWQVVPGALTMYNLEVAQDHTFTVGDGQWVVHNCARVNPFASLNDDGLLKPMRSHEALVEEHQQKLSAYIDDPMAQDNQGLLANAPTPEIRQKIYEGRIAQLQKQISRQQNDLQRILEEAQSRGLLP